MPNHESNYVVVLGPEDRIDALLASGFVRDATEEEKADAYSPLTHIIDFNAIVPQPENIERGGCNGQHAPGVVCWYRWNIDNWGTKWGGYDVSVVDRIAPTRLNLHFQTAWSQPTPVLRAIERDFDVQVLALTIDEGGFPDVFYGDEDDVWEVLSARRSVDFENYQTGPMKSWEQPPTAPSGVEDGE